MTSLQPVTLPLRQQKTGEDAVSVNSRHKSSTLATPQLKAFYTPDAPSQDEQHKYAKCPDTKCSDLNPSRQEFATETQENESTKKVFWNFAVFVTYRHMAVTHVCIDVEVKTGTKQVAAAATHTLASRCQGVCVF